MKRIKNYLQLCVSAVFLTACGEAEERIEGTWVEPVPGMEKLEQGFTLAEGGQASSVNMATLQYESWEKKEDVLILSGKSIGNGQTIEFSDTFPIARLTSDTLVLKRGMLSLTYSRKK